MDAEPQDYGKLLQDLAARSGMEWLRAAQRYSTFWQRVASGEMNQQQLREESIRFAYDETNHAIRNLAAMSRSYFTTLFELGRTFNPPLFDQAITAASSAQPATAAAVPPRVQLELRGLVGQDAIGSFVVTNHRLEPDQVSFVVSEFAGPINGTTFRPPLAIQPPRFTLGPHEQRRVDLRLPLLEVLFLPQQPYTAVINVQCRDPFELGVEVVATHDNALPG